MPCQVESEEWGVHARALLASSAGGPADGAALRFTPPRAGVDAGDHPPIVPVKAWRGGGGGGGGGDLWRLYALVTRHLLTTVSPDARFVDTTVTVLAGPRCSPRPFLVSLVFFFEVQPLNFACFRLV